MESYPSSKCTASTIKLSAATITTDELSSSFKLSTTSFKLSFTSFKLSSTSFELSTTTSFELSTTTSFELSTTSSFELSTTTSFKLSSSTSRRTEWCWSKCFISSFRWRWVKEKKEAFFLTIYLNNRQRKTNIKFSFCSTNSFLYTMCPSICKSTWLRQRHWM